MIATATASHSPHFTSSRSSRADRPGRLANGGYGSVDGGNRDGGGLSRNVGSALDRPQSSDDNSTPARSMTRGENVSRMYVRALYNYSTDDTTSLSFSQGDVIQVLKQLDSGWWDGIVHGQRGWFPSNYCALISPNDYANGNGGHSELDDSDDLDDDDSYDEYEEDDESDHDGLASPGLPLEGTDDKDNDEAAFWIPQATPDGRLYYFNTSTGASRMELPLETPTSTTETGPRDRSTFSAPEQTRPPPEMMARGYERDESYGMDDESLSERDGDHLHERALHRQSFISDTSDSESGNSFSFAEPESRAATIDSIATSVDSIRNVPSFKAGHNPSLSSSTAINVSGSATSPHPKALAYCEDGWPSPASWDDLQEKTGMAVERYRRAINSSDRAQYVRRAEDISDMLRLLIAAGSSTTDNHSGQPSIISGNKSLNPHFRHFMAAFSKLVLSSHVAATDCPPPDAEGKCLVEADEVMVGVFSFVQTARNQRGEALPRIKPGFIQGSTAGGSWRGVTAPPVTIVNGTKVPVPVEDPPISMDSALVDKMEELGGIVKPSLRKLEAALSNTESVVTEHQQAIIGLNVINAAQVAFDAIKRYFNLIDNINMVPFNNKSNQSPSFVDFVTHKQRLHDSFADLFLACQGVTASLADEWAAVRGEVLEDRLNFVKIYLKEVESGMRSLDFSTQLLVGEREKIQDPTEEMEIKTEVMRKQSDASYFEPQVRAIHQRTASKQLPRTSTIDGRPQGGASKLAKFFGDDPRQQPQPEPRQQTQLEPPPELPKYLEPDHDTEIVYGQKGQVKGGTLIALVERVTRHDMLDSNFNSTFLLCYPSFTTASDLFGLLVKRFTIQPPPGLKPQEFEEWTDKKQKLIRVRVLSIMKMWLESNWMEANDEKTRELLRKMYTFAKDVMLPQLAGTSQVLALIEVRSKGQDPENKRLILNHSAQPPPPLLPRNMKKLKFLDIDALEFARQLTIIESKSYAKLKANECLSKGWSKPPKDGGPDPAENIRSIIMQSNQLTNWVAEMILTQNEPRKRVIVIKHFISVAEKCRQLNNFSTLTAILAALQTASIHRLRRTWEHVPTRTNVILENMNTLMGATMNFAEYREMLHVVNPPCVPFLGVYLKDLTFVADGNDDFVKGTDLINFGKRVKTANIVREIQQYQSVPYPLLPVPELQDYIVHNMQSARDVNEMYSLSLALEPREREDEKIARLLQESGFL